MKRSFIEYMTIVIAFFVLAATVVLSIGMAIGKNRVNNTQNETVKYYSEKITIITKRTTMNFYIIAAAEKIFRIRVILFPPYPKQYG